MSVVQVSGQRSDGKLLLFEGYVYKRTSLNNGNQYVKCSRELCPSTGVIRNDNSVITVRTPHTHVPDKAEEELALYRHSLRVEASDISNAGGFRNICDKQSARFPVGSLLRGFPQDEQLMRRSRNQNLPPIPKDLDDLHNILNYDPQWRNFSLGFDSPHEFFRETVHAVDGSRVSVYVSPYLSDLMVKDGIEIAADGTFDVRPQCPQTEQLLSFHVSELVGEEYYLWPCAYALMERKSELSYVSALEAIKAAVGGHMHPSAAMADYEKSLHNAFKRVFPGIETSGCWFHYCNALQGYGKSLGLLNLWDVNQFAGKASQKCMALPLLPPGQIDYGLSVIEQSLEAEGLKNSFAPFIEYIKTYWLDDNKVGAETLSVFELISRTDNAVETSHFQLWKKLLLSRPNFWAFHHALKMFDYARHQDRQRVHSHVAIRRKKRQKYVTQDKNIKDMQEKLSRGEILVEEFLERACHTVEGLQKRWKKSHSAARIRD